MLEEYVEDNYYARFDTRSYHHFRETYLNARLDVNNTRRRKITTKSLSAKSRSRAPSYRACLKSMSKKITMQGSSFAAKLNTKSQQSHSSIKSRSRVLGRSAYLKGMWRTITMQVFLTLAAITVSEKSS